MPRRILLTVVTLLLCSALAASAQGWRAGVDPRVELMSILFRLAGNAEYNQCRIPAYDKAVDRWFAPYRDHEAVRLARGLGIGFEAPMKLAVYVTDVDSLAERVPFDGPGVHLYAGWDAAKARAFLKAARAFVVDTKFKDFLASQQPLYQVTNARLVAFVGDQGDLLWFSRFFGPGAPDHFVIVPGMGNGGPSYAAHFVDAGGAEEVYAIPGVWSVDAGALPQFDADWRNTMVHELAHSFCGPVVEKAAPQMEQAARQIFDQVSDAMRAQTYGSWRMLLDESMVRAVALRYVIDHDGAGAATRVVRQERARSFFWIGDLGDLLGQYEKDGKRYPTLDAFMPRVAQFFDELAPKVKAMAARYQPKVVSMSPADGALDVDPDLKQIMVRFNMPMSRNASNPDLQTPTPRFDKTGTLLTFPVALDPDKDYQLPLRWPDGRSFVSADGVPLLAVTVRFRTKAAPIAPAP